MDGTLLESQLKSLWKNMGGQVIGIPCNIPSKVLSTFRQVSTTQDKNKYNTSKYYVVKFTNKDIVAQITYAIKI